MPDVVDDVDDVIVKLVGVPPRPAVAAAVAVVVHGAHVHARSERGPNSSTYPGRQQCSPIPCANTSIALGRLLGGAAVAAAAAFGGRTLIVKIDCERIR